MLHDLPGDKDRGELLGEVVEVKSACECMACDPFLPESQGQREDEPDSRRSEEHPGQTETDQAGQP